MKIKFKRKISLLSNYPSFSIPSNKKDSVIIGQTYKVSVGSISFLRPVSILGGVPAVSLPQDKRDMIEVGKSYDIVLENGTVNIVL